MDNSNISNGKDNSLDTPDTAVKQTTNSVPADDSNSLDSASSEKNYVSTEIEKPHRGPAAILVSMIHHLNVYLLLFILIIILSGGIVFVAYQRNKEATTPTTINTTTLTGDTLDQIKGSDATVGDPKQTLTIASNAIFSGKVLIRDSLDIAGSLKVGSALSLTGVSVSGPASFDQLQANSITISGNTDIQGALTVQRGITSTSGATFGGPISAPQITTQSLQLSGDLQLVRHIDAGGGTPGKTDGTALGNGGTVSVSGTDIAGTVTINTGGSPGIGCFVTVNFTNTYSATPHIVASPIGSAAAGINYYLNRTASNFSICATNPAPAGQTFSFDYVAID